jgi:undecaprenyl-diphosphatase
VTGDAEGAGPVGSRRAWAAVLVASGVAFLALWLAVAMHWRGIDVMDRWGFDALDRYRHDAGWISWWRTFCAVLSPLTFDALAGLSAVASVVLGRWRDAVRIVVAMLGGQLVLTAVKVVSDRPRPGSGAHHAVSSSLSSSFPSDHSASAVIGFVLLLAIWWPALRRHHRWRALLATWTCVLVAVVLGAARIAVHAHHPSDVLAGWAFGLCWAAGCLVAA